MKAIDWPGADMTFVLPGGTQENDLRAHRCIDDTGRPLIASVWQPTKEELRLLQDGGNVRLEVWGINQPPVCITVTPVDVAMGGRGSDGIGS